MRRAGGQEAGGFAGADQVHGAFQALGVDDDFD